MLLGASTRSFGGKTVAETANIFSEAGLDTAELCFCQTDLPGWKYNFYGKAEIPSVKDIKNAVKAFADCGITVSALGFYGCFFGGTGSDMPDTLRSFTEYCNIALECGIGTIATHSGTAGFLPISRGFDSEVKRRLLDGFAFAAVEAHKRGLSVSVECSCTDVITGFDGYLEISRNVRDNLGTADMLKYTCVPVDDGLPINADTIGLCRIRDRKRDGKFYERFGDGDFDFSQLFGFVKKNPDVPLILEYVNSENVRRTARELLELVGD